MTQAPPKKRRQPFASDAMAARAERRKRGAKTHRDDVEAWVGDDASGISDAWDVDVGVTVHIKDLVKP